MPNNTARSKANLAFRPGKALHRFSSVVSRSGSTAAQTGHLAHIVLPHTASPSHDDVIDGSALRGAASARVTSFPSLEALAILGDEEVTGGWGNIEVERGEAGGNRCLAANLLHPVRHGLIGRVARNGTSISKDGPQNC